MSVNVSAEIMPGASRTETIAPATAVVSPWDEVSAAIEAVRGARAQLACVDAFFAGIAPFGYHHGFALSARAREGASFEEAIAFRRGPPDWEGFFFKRFRSVYESRCELWFSGRDWGPMTLCELADRTSPASPAAVLARAAQESFNMRGLVLESLAPSGRRMIFVLFGEAPDETPLAHAAVEVLCHALRRRMSLLHAGDCMPQRARLSGRELDVLQNISLGRTDRDIAARFGVHERTVSKQVASLMAKLSARTRAEAVAIALRGGVIE